MTYSSASAEVLVVMGMNALQELHLKAYYRKLQYVQQHTRGIKVQRPSSRMWPMPKYGCTIDLDHTIHTGSDVLSTERY